MTLPRVLTRTTATGEAECDFEDRFMALPGKDTKKKIRVKKMHPDVANAQYALDHAVVRGEPENVLEDLRNKLNAAKGAKP